MGRINVRRIMIALGIGVGINVLVAWFVQRFPIDPSLPVETEPEPWPIWVPSDWPPVNDPSLVAHNIGVTHIIHCANLTLHISKGLDGHSTVMYTVEESRFGLPMRALRSVRGSAFNIQGSTALNVDFFNQGLPLPLWVQRSNWIGLWHLPLRPLWPGFAINTIFYGTFAFAAMAGASALRRRRRFKRGLCMQCAYPRTGGDLCPECGTAVASSAKPPVPAAEPVGPTPV